MAEEAPRASASELPQGQATVFHPWLFSLLFLHSFPLPTKYPPSIHMLKQRNNNDQQWNLLGFPPVLATFFFFFIPIGACIPLLSCTSLENYPHITFPSPHYPVFILHHIPAWLPLSVLHWNCPITATNYFLVAKLIRHFSISRYWTSQQHRSFDLLVGPLFLFSMTT